MKAILRLDSAPENRTTTPARRWLAGFEWFFLLVGLVALDTYVWVNTSSLLSQAYQDWSFDQTLRGVTPSSPVFLADEFSWMFGGQREKVEAPEAVSKLQPMPQQGKPPLPASLIGRLE